MEESKQHLCASVGMKISLLCAALGVITAFSLMFAIFGANGVYDLLIDEGLQIQAGVIAGIIALFIFAASLGRIAGKVVCRKARGLTGAAFVGICLALGCVALSIVAGAPFSFLVQELSDTYSPHKSSLFIFIVAPLYWIMMFGALPAMLLGVLYGALVRRKLAKLAR